MQQHMVLKANPKWEKELASKKQYQEAFPKTFLFLSDNG